MHTCYRQHTIWRSRQQCTHATASDAHTWHHAALAQVGSSGLRALSGQAAPMTMDEILSLLVAKARLEAEEAQRQLLAALNGLAGLCLLEGQRAEAVATYREALRLGDDNGGRRGRWGVVAGPRWVAGGGL